MAKRDYYEVLGLSNQASLQEIKTAFRTKAKVLHPDKNSGDEAAFKELGEAYEVLSNEEKRRIYDRYGHEGLKGSSSAFDHFDFNSFAGFGIDELLEQVFGATMRSAGRRGGPEVGSHLQYELVIDFLEAVFGGEKTVSINRMQECELCSGSGAAPGSKSATCSTCNGQGQVQQVINSWFGQSIRVSECPSCQGAGKRIEKPCRTCKGAGLERKPTQVKVRIPAGIESGSRLRIVGNGDKGRNGGTFGDLFIFFRVKEHERFIRDGDNIFIKHTISFSQAALGAQISVPTVDGIKVLGVPAGTQSNALLVMKNLGVPRLNNPNRRGDHLVQLVVETPTKLSAQEKQLLEQLAKLRGEDQEIGQNGDDSLINKFVDAFKPKHEDAV